MATPGIELSGRGGETEFSWQANLLFISTGVSKQKDTKFISNGKRLSMRDSLFNIIC